MRILLLMESLPESGAYTGIIQSGIIDSLLSGGHQVSIICNRVNISLSVLYEKIDWQQPFRPQIRNFHKRNFSDFLGNITGNRKHEIEAWKQVIGAALCRQQYDLILSLPDSEHFQSCFAMLSMKITIPWIVNFPQLLFNTFYRSGSHLMGFGPEYKYRRQIEDVLHAATYISFASYRISAYMKLLYKELKSRCLYLPYPCVCTDKLSYFPSDRDAVLDLSKFNILLVDSLDDSAEHRRFLNAYMRFLDYVDQSKVMLTIVGAMASSLRPTGLRQSLTVIEKPVSYRRCQELIRESSVLLTMDHMGGASFRLYPALSSYVASGRPILAISPPESETSRLLGDYYPYRCNYNDPDEVCMILLQMWDEWQDKAKPKAMLNDVAYLFGNQNFNAVISMAVKQHGETLAGSCRLK